MDPDVTLIEIRHAIAAILKLDPDGGPDAARVLARRAVDLAEWCNALDEWISGGGFLPASWQRGRDCGGQS